MEGLLAQSEAFLERVDRHRSCGSFELDCFTDLERDLNPFDRELSPADKFAYSESDEELEDEAIDVDLFAYIRDLEA